MNRFSISISNPRSSQAVLPGQIARRLVRAFRPDIACATTHTTWTSSNRGGVRPTRRDRRSRFRRAFPSPFALRDMSQELEGVASCFNLVAAKRVRCASGWACRWRASASSAIMRAFQALRVLLEDPPPEPRADVADAIIEHTVKSFAEELRLTGLAHVARPARRADPA